jgi:catechol 2,3-dioxygenase-like lactoylglutathione lyase family enzyme
MSPDEASDAYPLAQVNRIVSELECSRRFYARLGWRFRTMGDQALMAEAPGGLLVALHLPDFTRTWNSGYEGATGWAAVLDVDVPDRETVDRLHAELVADGHQSPQPPFDAFFGSRYAIVRDPDGNLIGLKSPR